MIAYCDYIAHTIRESLVKDPDWLLSHVDKVKWDMSEDGILMSTVKIIGLEDNNGKKYKITVEEA